MIHDRVGTSGFRRVRSVGSDRRRARHQASVGSEPHRFWRAGAELRRREFFDEAGPIAQSLAA
jgi:hypothetical protein